MAIFNDAEITAGTVTSATDVVLTVTYRPVEQDLGVTPSVGALVGDTVYYTTDASQAVLGPAGSTLTTLTLEMYNFDFIRDRVRFNYNGILKERVTLTVSSA